MTHKRSPEGNQHRIKRQSDFELLEKQKQIAKWLLEGTHHKDDVKKEQIATIPSEYVLDYIAECHSDPDPSCVPAGLDGTVLHDPLGLGIFDVLS